MNKLRTTIVLSKKTVDKLKSLGKKGESYEDIVSRLLRKHDKKLVNRKEVEA